VSVGGIHPISLLHLIVQQIRKPSERQQQHQADFLFAQKVPLTGARITPDRRPS
jgi:hypothetical protein